MSSVLACIDESAYAASVCDHASWFAGRMDAGITLLHVREPSSPAIVKTRREDLVIDLGLERLTDHGASDVHPIRLKGAFSEIAAATAANAELVVAGKRGARSDGVRRQLGSNVDGLIRNLDAPICLVSQVFLPISRAVVLIDAVADHRRTVEFVASYAALRDLDMDLVMMAGATGGAEKLEWARTMLAAEEASVLPVPAEGPDAAAVHYLETRKTDLIIISREVLLAEVDVPLQNSDQGSFWRWRTPVLVC